MYVPEWLLKPSAIELEYRRNERTRLLLDMRTYVVETCNKLFFSRAHDLATTLADEFEEARWLLRVFPTRPKDRGQVTITFEVIARVYSDHMACFYLALMENNKSLMHKAASLGNEIAKIRLLEEPTLEQIMSVNDRAHAYTKFPNHPYAAYMGDANAMARFADTLHEYSPEQHVWRARVVVATSWPQVKFCEAILANGRHFRLVVGFLLKNSGDLREIYRVTDNKTRIKGYDACIKRIKDAVYAWAIVAKRLGLYADIRTLIGQLVWSNFVDFADEPTCAEVPKRQKF